MKVGYLSDAFARNSKYGLSRYAWELFYSIRKYHKVIPISLYSDLNQNEKAVLKKKYDFYLTPLGRKVLAGLWSYLSFPPAEWLLPQINIIHSVELAYPICTRKPWIVTVHDIGPLTHPKFFSVSRPYLKKKAMKLAIKKADKILAVSQSTANDIETYFKVSLNDRLEVIPEGVSKSLFLPPNNSVLENIIDLPLKNIPFFLWTGSFNPRKNLKKVIQSFNIVAEKIPHHLVLVGGIGWDAHDAIKDIELSKYKNRIHRPGYISDAQLHALYCKASAFIYISLMEGFGLPILEAMACKCPVITSNISSMPEVAGNCAYLVDPKNENEIADVLIELSENHSSSKQLIEKGYKRALSFTWHNTALKTSKIYKDIAR